MEEGYAHCLALGRDGQGFGFRRRGKMRHRLADGKIHEANAHAGGKQHGDPGQVPELGF
jgi:hypothetical protein